MSLYFLRIVIYESKSKGITARMCAACQAPGHHTVREIRGRSWLWGLLPLWSTRLLDETRCCLCGLRTPTVSDEPVPVVPDRGQSLGELAEDTNPSLFEIYAHLDDDEAQDSPVPVTEFARQTQIVRAFEATAGMFEYAKLGVAPCRLLHRAALVMLFILLAIIAVAISSMLAVIARGAPAPNAPLPTSARIGGLLSAVLILTFIAGIPICLLIWLTRIDRFLKHEAVPVLVRILAHLRPSEAELILPLEQLRKRKLYIGKAVKPHRLVRQIEAHLAEQAVGDGAARSSGFRSSADC